MATAVEMSATTAVVEIPAVQPSTPKIVEAETENADFDSNSSVMSESPDIAAKNSDSDSIKSSMKSDNQMKDFVEMLRELKLNPLAKEFFPSSYNRDHLGGQFVPAMSWGNDVFPNYRRRKNNYGQGKKRVNGRSFKAQREDNIRRTVYVADIDHNIFEEQLAALFSFYGQVVDCRVCGDPHSRLRFAFVEFDNEYSAHVSLTLSGAMLGFSPIKVLPSKTAILPVNPTFLPRSADEREMCARTVYCTNIDKQVSQADMKDFFETRCGKVNRLRLLGDQLHSTRIGFVEFEIAESAVVALNCCGQMLGSQPVRVSPSKTPVRPRS